jgi:flagellar basal-body rod protein FlgC
MLSIAASGLDAATAQLTASASNIANAQTVGALSPSSPAARAYQPVTVVLSQASGGGVTASIATFSQPTTAAYAPDSPYADAQGMVAAPNVDPAHEVVSQLSTLQAFQANLATIRVAEDMQKRLLAVV